MSAAGNRARVALQLADAWGHYAPSCSSDPMTPAEVLAFAEGADDHEWSVVEALAGRPADHPASEATRATTLAVLAERATTADDDPFASFQRDRTGR